MLRKVWIPKNIARRPAARTETYPSGKALIFMRSLGPTAM